MRTIRLKFPLALLCMDKQRRFRRVTFRHNTFGRNYDPDDHWQELEERDEKSGQWSYVGKFPNASAALEEILKSNGRDETHIARGGTRQVEDS